MAWNSAGPSGTRRSVSSEVSSHCRAASAVAIATKASQKLKDYPYQFQVLRVEGGTAVMSTPRNFDSPAFRMLGVLYPDINVKDANNPAFIAVERLLGQVQDEAKDIVLAQPGITDVRWELDKGWLRRKGIEVPDKP